MQYTLNHRVLDIEVRSIKLGLVSYTTEPGGGPWTRRLSEAATHVGGCAPELLLDLGMHSSKKALLFAAKLLFEARFVGNEDHVRVWVERLGALEATQAAPAPAAPTPANTAPTVPAPPPSSALPADAEIPRLRRVARWVFPRRAPRLPPGRRCRLPAPPAAPAGPGAGG